MKIFKINKISVTAFSAASLILIGIMPSQAKGTGMKPVSKETILKLDAKVAKPVSSLYTGLVIKVKDNQDFQGRMSPRVVSENGNIVYCNVDGLTSAQFTLLIDRGLATFTNSLDSAKNRTGKNPLVIEAIKVENSDTAVITNDSARKIIEADNRAKFLRSFNVSFVIEKASQKKSPFSGGNEINPYGTNGNERNPYSADDSNEKNPYLDNSINQELNPFLDNSPKNDHPLIEPDPETQNSSESKTIETGR